MVIMAHTVVLYMQVYTHIHTFSSVGIAYTHFIIPSDVYQSSVVEVYAVSINTADGTDQTVYLKMLINCYFCTFECSDVHMVVKPTCQCSRMSSAGKHCSETYTTHATVFRWNGFPKTFSMKR